MRPGPSWSRKARLPSPLGRVSPSFNEAGTKLVPERVNRQAILGSRITFNEAGTKLVPESKSNPPMPANKLPLQ